MTPRFASLLGLALAASACDGLGDEGTHGTPLLTVRGTMVPGETMALEVDEIRMALAWYPGLLREEPISSSSDEESCFVGYPTDIVTQEIAYEPVFPIEFRFDVTSPPPPEAVVAIDDPDFDGKAALGLLVAYEDRNHNGTLDACPLGGPCVDRVLGASGDMFGPPREGTPQIFVLYVDRAYDDPEGTIHFEPGLNLIDMTTEDGVLPLDTSIRIELTEDPRMQQVSCDQVCSTFTGGGPVGCGGDTSSGECSVETPEIPEGATVECHDGGRSLVVTTITCETVCSCQTDQIYVTLAPTQAVPADWPCPVL